MPTHFYVCLSVRLVHLLKPFDGLTCHLAGARKDDLRFTRLKH